MKKNSKKLLILSSLLLVACGGGTGTSLNSGVSSENSSVVSASEPVTSDVDSGSSSVEVKSTVVSFVNLSNSYISDSDYNGFKKGDELVVGNVETVTITQDYNITDEAAVRYVIQVNDKVYRPVRTSYDENTGISTLTFEITVPEEDMNVYLCMNDALETSNDGFKVSLVDSAFAKLIGVDTNEKYTGNFRAILYVDPGFAPSKVEYRKVGTDSWVELTLWFNNSMATISGLNLTDIASDIEIRVTGEYVGVYNITYKNMDKVRAGYSTFPTVSQPGKDIYISFEDSLDYYSSSAPTITGLSADALANANISTSSISFTMPENDVEIEFNVTEKIEINFIENSNVTSVKCRDQASTSWGNDLTKVKPGETVYFFVDAVSGYAVSGIKINNGDLIAPKTNEWTGLTYIECEVPEDITEFNVSVVTDEASPVTIITNATAESGCSVTTSSTSYSPSANVRVSIESSAFYAIDEENVKVYSRVDGTDTDITFTFGRDWSDNINSLSFTMPEESCEVFVEVNFVERSTTNLTLSVSESDMANVDYLSVSGNSSAMNIGNGESNTFIAGEIIYVSISMKDNSHEPTKLVIKDAAEGGNELATYDYYLEYGYGTFGDITLPSDDNLFIFIEFKENSPLTYSIEHDGIDEGEFSLQYQLDWNTTLDDLGTCYPGTQFSLVINGDAGEGKQFVAYITDLDGNVISTQYGSYTVSEDFVIVVEKVSVVKMSVNIDDSLGIQGVTITDDSYNYYYDNSDVVGKTHLSTYSIYSSVEFKCEVVCNGVVVYQVSSTPVEDSYSLQLDFTAPDSEFSVNFIPVTTVSE